MKTCRLCGVLKTLDEFYRHPQMAGGRDSKCKACAKAMVTTNRNANVDRFREYDRERAKLPHRVALNIATTRQYRREHPDRYAAHVALNNAIRAGRVKPWPVCAVPECNGKPVAHHPDYSRPLEVVWLCQKDHKAAHAAI